MPWQAIVRSKASSGKRARRPCPICGESFGTLGGHLRRAHGRSIYDWPELVAKSSPGKSR